VAGDRKAHQPRKRFGQHFLTDRRSLERIVEAIQPESTDIVVEIGPGKGALTDLLSARCGRLIAIEIDRDLVATLRERFQEQPSVEVVEGDALEVNWAALAGDTYLLAANLPYYITTPLIFRILESPMARRAALLVQREVAERLVAEPGSSEYGALTVNVQVAAAVRTIGRVSAGAFHPKPKVDSAIVLLAPRPEPLLGADEQTPFRKFVQAIFGMRRKQMLRVLREQWIPSAESATAVLIEAGIDPAARPETLGPDAFVRLFRLTRMNADQDLEHRGR
jgi:16S rRNA (adenine1518-N6/adenine1519-N6)-dimethyltransferase